MTSLRRVFKEVERRRGFGVAPIDPCHAAAHLFRAGVRACTVYAPNGAPVTVAARIAHKRVFAKA